MSNTTNLVEHHHWGTPWEEGGGGSVGGGVKDIPLGGVFALGGDIKIPHSRMKKTGWEYR